MCSAGSKPPQKYWPSLLPGFHAGRAVAAAEEGAEVRLDRVGLGVPVALALVAQLVVDDRLVAVAAAGRRRARPDRVGGVGEVAELVLDDHVIVPGGQVVELRRARCLGAAWTLSGVG